VKVTRRPWRGLTARARDCGHRLTVSRPCRPGSTLIVSRPAACRRVSRAGSSRSASSCRLPSGAGSRPVPRAAPAARSVKFRVRAVPADADTHPGDVPRPGLAATRAGWSASLSCLLRPQPRAGPRVTVSLRRLSGQLAIPCRPRPAVWPAAPAGPAGATCCRPATLSPTAWSLLSLRAESSARAAARHRVARAAGLRAALPVQVRSGRRRPASCPKCAP